MYTDLFIEPEEIKNHKEGEKVVAYKELGNLKIHQTEK